MIDVRQTTVYRNWVAELRDINARARIRAQVKKMSLGNFGDVKPVGNGVSELRIHYGLGYRIYFVRRGREIVILLCGGDKSGQAADIAKAKDLAKEI